MINIFQAKAVSQVRLEGRAALVDKLVVMAAFLVRLEGKEALVDKLAVMAASQVKLEDMAALVDEEDDSKRNS